MRTRRIYLLLFFSLIVFEPFYCFSQAPYFRSIKSSSLPADIKINKTFSDSSGFVWVATSAGLYKYDGLRFVYFSRHDGVVNEATSFYEDSKGGFWTGYRDGTVNHVENGKNKVFQTEEGSFKAPVTGITTDISGNIWFATYGEGLYCYTGKRLYNFNKADGLRDDFVYTLLALPDGTIWAGTDGGIAICSFPGGEKHVRALTTNEGLPDNIVMSLSFDGESVWIGTQSKGICRYQPASRKILKTSSQPWTYGAAVSILSYSDELWVATTNGGILVFDRLKQQIRSIFNKKNTFFNNHVTSLMKDAEGNIWLCDNSSGFYITRPTMRFAKVETNNQPVNALLHDKEGNTWYATNKETYIIKASGKIRKIDVPAISMYEDKFGCIWLGTFGDGLYRFMNSESSPKHLTEKDGLINGNVLSINGSGEEIWFSTLGGVSKCRLLAMDEVIFSSFKGSEGLGSNFIYQVFVDKGGRAWFATDGKGISVYDHGKFTNYEKTLKSNVVYSITQDKFGKIWFSTAGAGIYSFDGRTFTNYNEKDGLKELPVTGLVADGRGNIVAMHKNGIDIINAKSGEVCNYGETSGVGDIDPGLNALYRDKDQNVWIGSKGIIIGYHAQEGTVFHKPLTRINQVLVYLSDSVAGRNDFTHKQNHISFDYSGLWYQDPEQVTYRVKLEGYDMEWSVSKNNFITYPSLPPGEYIFHVQSSANNSFTNADTQSYIFNIEPPFWSTTWFYLLSFIGLGIGLIMVVRGREQRLRIKERREKDKVEFQFETLKSQVNPHFLFNSFNTLIAIIEKDTKTAVEYVERLSDFYRNVLMSRLQNQISLEEELQMLEQYFYLQQRRFKENLILKNEVPKNYYSYLMAPLTLQLLVENAIKHNAISNSSPLTISLYIENDSYLVIKNTLKPKMRPEPSTGLGLQNIRNRYALFDKKEVIVEQSLTDFIVKIPLIKP